MRKSMVRLAILSAAVLAALPVAALAPGRAPSRFDRLVLQDPSADLGVRAESPEGLADAGVPLAAWKAFQSADGAPWQVHLDRRTGAPLLVEGAGLRWFDGKAVPTPVELEAKARAFLAANAGLFRVDPNELVVDLAGTGAVDDDRAVVVFRRQASGIEVEDQRFVLRVVRGNLVSFGTSRWGELGPIPAPRVTVESARETLYGYMGILPHDRVTEIENGRDVLVAAPPAGSVDRAFAGAVGTGIRFLRAYLFVLRVSGESGTWVGKVDAVTGKVLALYDDAKYGQVKGGVYPISDDLNCADYGCELAGYPMPYADITINGSSQTAGDAGMFTCSPGGATAVTHLAGPYIRINTLCGAVSESVACDADVDLGTSAGTDCATPAGRSAGDTHSARSSFFHINRIKEKGRYWLPSNTWLASQLQVNLDLNQTCNAYWDGASVNFFKSGGGCRNTGEIAGVFNHEYGHGLDENDGGGYDNPSEAYADVTAIVEERRSCVGRGFYESGTCSGYGDPCLSCTGIRDMDYAQHQSNTPATPSGFISPNCGGGSGACGREVHCESYVPSETIFDLATRDLPAAGYDAKTSWQIAERLWYKSRQGSGGNVFNCTLPNSDGCNANGWFNSMRTADDDDGNLSNGTPHAAAIFAAFNRHKIACGGPTDPSNQSTSSCPALAAPALSASAGSGAASLSWGPVTNASNYVVLRTEVSCDYSQNAIATVPAPGTNYTDTDLPNSFPFYYRVVARGSNSACEGAVSNCVQVTPQPFSGTVTFDRATYSCSSLLTVSVLDANVGGPTTTVKVFSTTETAPETVVLTETPPGSSKYVGTITATSGPAVNGDGLISVHDGDTVTAQYLDADDGNGNTNVLKSTTAATDCVVPLISQIQTTNITDVHATVSWSTNEASTSTVNWGPVKPPAGQNQDASLVTSHSIDLNGLQSCTAYWYSVQSSDYAGNVALDDKSGQYYYFETLGNFGSGLQPCHKGTISLDRATYGCSDVLSIKLIDIDLNLSPTVADTVVVKVSSSTEATPELVTLTETGPNTSQFTGTIATSPAAPVAGDGILQTSDGDILTATYDDANDGSGQGAVAFKSATADCASPTFSGVAVTDIHDDQATVRWTTSEPSTSKVDWGLSSALGSTVSDNTLVTSHALTVGPLNECGRVYFRATSTDAYGNTRVYDAAGSPFQFNADLIPAFFKDTFENSSGWTLEGEWQINSPQGKGTSSPDPTTAFEGSKVLGHDLTGLGAHPGDYEPQKTESAASPVINATSLSRGQLKFRRWLNVGGGGISFIEVKKGSTWNTVWQSNSLTGNTETSWSLQTVDISAYADANASLQVRFRQYGGLSSSANRSGWNVDRFIIHSGNTPDFDACGACGGAPTFAGIASASDVNACAGTGIQLGWAQAPGWGTGRGGTYVIYRDTNPSFTPSAANQIARGVSGTSYTDTTVPANTTVYYIVRAENDETCSTGPNNGGVVDGNLVRLSSLDQTSQPAPGDVAASVRATPVNQAHVRVTWSPTGSAAKYHVYSAQSAQGPFTLLAEVAGTLFDDRDEMGDSANRYYLVRAVDACGNEGP